MDGFDDLLAPNRNALESNPFAEGFDSQSSSADPWASPFGANAANEGFGDSYDSNPFSNLESSYSAPRAISRTPTPESFTAPQHKEDPKPELEVSPPSDPLDSANATLDDDEDNRPLGTLRSPGFRESIAPSTRPTLDSPALTPRTRSPESAEIKAPAKVTVAPPSAIQAQHIQEAAAASGSKIHVASPLEEPATNSLEQSLGGLALGPDVLGSSTSASGRGWGVRDDEGWGRTELPSPPAPAPQAIDDDSDDDRPIGQSLKRSSLDGTLSPPTAQSQKDDNGLPPLFVITVDDPQKVGDPLRPYIMYTVHTRTTSPLFQKSAFSVLRRYSDFVWLYHTLCFNNPGVVVPPVPEKSSFGRFEDQFVRQRRLGLEKCIQKMANHPVLSKDTDLRLFLESDNFSLEMKHRKVETPHENKSFIASIGQSLTGPRFHETDDWFDKQRSYLDSLESQLRGLAKTIELVARHRTEMATAIGECAQAVTDLSSSDVGKQLSHALAELAEVERKAQEMEGTQSDQDLSTFMATVDEYARLINSVRAAFSSRVRVYNAWKATENDLLRTKQTHEKNRAQGKIPPERLGHSLSQIAEAERRAQEAKHEYEHVSKLVKSEVARFEQERIEDFKDTLHAFLEGMISRQKELITHWENYQQLLLKRVGGGGPAALGRTSQDDS
ncbi:protein transporter [Coprinopsis sp. MPI-PUGE-AT-0042]|nr:protein transporter [Coprinopsis sp. MPI-PUGE-AT-0042]